MVSKEKPQKSTVFSFRLPNNLLKKIDKMAEVEQIDRASWIKRAMVIAIEELEDSAVEGAIEDFIAGKMSEKEFIGETSYEEVPEDIKEARKNYIAHIEDRLKKRDVKQK